MKKQYFIIGLFIVVVSVFFISRTNRLPNQKQSISKISVYQKIAVRNQPTDFIKHAVGQSTTAWQLLKQTNQIKSQGDGAMAFVTEINGTVANQKNKEYWAFYINEKPATVGAGSYQLKNNDKIEWKIEKF